jgi:hypothetical protein
MFIVVSVAHHQLELFRKSFVIALFNSYHQSNQEVMIAAYSDSEVPKHQLLLHLTAASILTHVQKYV